MSHSPGVRIWGSSRRGLGLKAHKDVGHLGLKGLGSRTSIVEHRLREGGEGA